jgi:hypothetical protein
MWKYACTCGLSFIWMHATFHGSAETDHKHVYGFHDAANNMNQFIDYLRLKYTNQVLTHLTNGFSDALVWPYNNIRNSRRWNPGHTCARRPDVWARHRRTTAITSRWCWWKSNSVGMVERRLSIVDAEAIDQPPGTALTGGAHMWTRYGRGGF